MKKIKNNLFAGIFIICVIICLSCANAFALPYQNKSAYDMLLSEMGIFEMEMIDDMEEPDRYEPEPVIYDAETDNFSDDFPLDQLIMSDMYSGEQKFFFIHTAANHVHSNAAKDEGIYESTDEKRNLYRRKTENENDILTRDRNISDNDLLKKGNAKNTPPIGPDESEKNHSAELLQKDRLPNDSIAESSRYTVTELLIYSNEPLTDKPEKKTDIESYGLDDYQPADSVQASWYVSDVSLSFDPAQEKAIKDAIETIDFISFKTMSLLAELIEDIRKLRNPIFLLCGIILGSMIIMKK